MQFGVRPSFDSITNRRILFAQAEKAANLRLSEAKRLAEAWELRAAAAKAEAEAAQAELSRLLSCIVQEKADAKTPARLTGAEILAQVAEKHGFSISDVKSVCRRKALVLCRQEACYRIAVETPLSLPQIGKVMGGRDHTTVLHSIRRHAALHSLPRPRGIPE